MPNTPDRSYNNAQISNDFVHDGIGSDFPYLKLTLSSAAGYAFKILGSVATGVFYRVDGDSLTTGSLMQLVSNSASTGTRSLVSIVQDHSSAVNATALSVTQDSTANAVSITTTAAGNSAALSITSSATTVTNGVINITGAAVTTGSGIKITLAELTTGSGVDLTGLAATKQNFNLNSSTGSTAAPQTNAPTGFFKIGIAGTDQWVPYYSAT